MWARLRQTANPGDRQLFVAGSVDWQEGDIVRLEIPDEFRRVVGSRPLPAQHAGGPPDTEVLIDTPLRGRHHSLVEEHGGYTIDMRTEVGIWDSANRLNIRIRALHKNDHPYFRFRWWSSRQNPMHWTLKQ